MASIDEGHEPREVKPRDLSIGRRCTCSSPDAWHPDTVPPMFHPSHVGVCGV